MLCSQNPVNSGGELCSVHLEPACLHRRRRCCRGVVGTCVGLGPEALHCGQRPWRRRGVLRQCGLVSRPTCTAELTATFAIQLASMSGTDTIICTGGCSDTAIETPDWGFGCAHSVAPEAASSIRAPECAVGCAGGLVPSPGTAAGSAALVADSQLSDGFPCGRSGAGSSASHEDMYSGSSTVVRCARCDNNTVWVCVCVCVGVWWWCGVKME